jgi:Type VI secretion system/phage-baseplate injector OB domain
VRHPCGSSLLFVALLTTAASTAQDRATLFVTINGTPIPPAAQPRVVLEQQRGAVDVARIKVAGAAGLEYARAIAPGDAIEITARSRERAATSIFSGEIVSVEHGVDPTHPSVVIHAANEVPRTDAAPSPAIRIDHDGSGGDARLVAFLAALSSTSSLQEVLVIGIDAATGAPVTGRAVAPTIPLGGGSDDPFGTTLTVTINDRFSSLDEANAFALRILTERVASRVSAELLTDGIPDIKVGGTIELEGTGTAFDGAYIVTGVQHRIGPDSNGGYSTVLRVRRADLGMFFLPAVDDEVLVTFEHGDLSRPIFLGSWWGCDAKPPSERSDDSDHCRLLRWPW